LRPSIAIPSWQLEHEFHPVAVISNSVRWVTKEKVPIADSGTLLDGNQQITPDFCEKVLHGQEIAYTSLLAFRDPDSFCAGQLHKHVAAWQRITAVAPYPEASKVVGWIKDGVCVHDFFQPFRGAFKGHDYDSDLPPPVIFDNSVSCQLFAKFISDTILARLASGAISVWGQVGVVDPPHLVMPSTVVQR
jgi:hypothetical protein